MIVIGISGLIALLAAIYIATPVARAGSRVVGLGLVGLIGFGAFASYFVNGEPENPGQPYSALVERLRTTDSNQLTPIEFEEYLRDAIRNEPTDIVALTELARFLSGTGRELEAISLYERVLRQGEDARILSDIGQALINLNDGDVTPPAITAFQRANTIDPNLPEPAFFLGAAAYADGDRATATEYWADMIGRLPPEDPYRQAIAQRAADMLSRPMAGPSSGGEAPFANGEEVDVEAMISAMVERLELRLADEPGDLSGWLTLARARMMMEEPEQAAAALDAARERFDGQPGKIALVTALSTAFGFEESDA